MTFRKYNFDEFYLFLKLDDSLITGEDIHEEKAQTF